MTKEERTALLSKPNWDYKDVMKFTGKKKMSAYSIIEKARSSGGRLALFPHQASRDSILALLGTTAEREISILHASTEATASSSFKGARA